MRNCSPLTNQSFPPLHAPIFPPCACAFGCLHYHVSAQPHRVANAQGCQNLCWVTFSTENSKKARKWRHMVANAQGCHMVVTDSGLQTGWPISTWTSCNPHFFILEIESLGICHRSGEFSLNLIRWNTSNCSSKYSVTNQLWHNAIILVSYFYMTEL